MHNKQACHNTLAIPNLLTYKNNHFEQDHDQSISTITEIGDSENWTMNRSNNSNILDMFASFKYPINHDRSRSISQSGNLVKQLNIGCLKLIDEDFYCEQTPKQQLKKSLCPLIINQNSHCFIEDQKPQLKTCFQRLKQEFYQFKVAITRELSCFNNSLKLNYTNKLKQALTKIFQQVTNMQNLQEAYKQLGIKYLEKDKQLNKQNQILKTIKVELNKTNQLLKEKTIQHNNIQKLLQIQKKQKNKLQRKLQQATKIQELSHNLKSMIQYSSSFDKCLRHSLQQAISLSKNQLSTLLKRNNLAKKRICHIFTEITNSKDDFYSFNNFVTNKKSHTQNLKQIQSTHNYIKQTFKFRPKQFQGSLISQPVKIESKSKTLENESQIVDRLQIEPQISRLKRTNNSLVNSKIVDSKRYRPREESSINNDSVIKAQSKQKCQESLLGLQKKINSLKREITSNMKV